MGILAGDVVRTMVHFQLADGSQYQNVFHHKRSGVDLTITNAQHVAYIKAWTDPMYSELNAVAKDDIVEVLSYVDKVEWVVDAWEVVENIGSFTPAVTFAGAGSAMPNQISSFVTFKTLRPKSVGRKFLFPFTEANHNAGIMDATLLAAVVAWADDAVNDIPLTALNYLVPGIPRTDEDTWLEFTLAVVTDLCGTQRRRRPGVGA